jgi:16S rRNA (uracil1498-N3)-methyltransferase
MRTTRVYFNGVLTVQTELVLPPATSHYVIHVLRLKPGSNVILFNGGGEDYAATLIKIIKKQAILSIDHVVLRETDSPLKIHLAQAILKSEKMDWVIQKAVELGVSSITPLITDYCSVKLDKERAERRLKHWGDIIISACEQSGRTRLPLLSNSYELHNWVQVAQAAIKICCHPGASLKMKHLESPLASDILLLIGPEGGFSDKEITLACHHDFIQISLGQRILRAETAALTAIAIAQSQWGDM